jgi:glycosyltransferase involved in cell wall biosynthesis
MRIGVMLRHYEQHSGGVRVYTQELLERLLNGESEHEFVLMYQNPGHVGMYAGRPGVQEVAVRLPGGVLWDQLAVPWLARRHRVDVIFNPKFTVPFLTHRPTVFVLHGWWFRMPDGFLWYDRIYTRIFVPCYIRRATKVIAVSHHVRQDALGYTRVDPGKVVTVHNGFDRQRFVPIHDAHTLARVRERYRLPPSYVLWAGQIYPPKNFTRMIGAFSRVRNDITHTLVIAGEPRWHATAALARISQLNLDDRVHFIGWVPHEDLPALYTMADLFLFPSIYEGFGIPLLEAMGCGCPILTSRTGAPPELVGDAAWQVNPFDEVDVAEGMLRILSDPTLRDTLVTRGLQRVRAFSWERCAREVLAVLATCGTRRACPQGHEPVPPLPERGRQV